MAKNPIIVGTTLDEMRIGLMTNPEIEKMTQDEFVRSLEQIAPFADTQKLIETYRAERSRRGEPTSPVDIALAIRTDIGQRMGAIRLAEVMQQRNQRAYVYIFTWKSTAMGGKLGALHGLDVGLTFGTHTAALGGTGPAADACSRNLQEYWISFARTGDPSCNWAGEWPVYGSQRATMMISDRCHVEEAPFEAERRFWMSLPPEMQARM